MPMFDETHLKIDGCFIIFDSVTKPQIVAQGKNAGKQKFELKVVIPPQSPDLPLYDALAKKALQESKWRGQLPQGGKWPFTQVSPDSSAGQFFAGWYQSTLRSLYLPKVHDESGAVMDPMQYGQLVYTGQKVNVLLHCYDYSEAGNQGIGAGLDGVQLCLSANAPRLEIATGGVDSAAAFGGQSSYVNQQPAQGQNYGAPQQQQQPQNFSPAPQGGSPQYGGQPQQQQYGHQQPPANTQGYNPQQQQPQYGAAGGHGEAGQYAPQQQQNHGYQPAPQNQQGQQQQQPVYQPANQVPPQQQQQQAQNMMGQNW